MTGTYTGFDAVPQITSINIRRTHGTAVLATFSDYGPAEARRRAFQYCRNTQTYGFIFEEVKGIVHVH